MKQYDWQEHFIGYKIKFFKILAELKNFDFLLLYIPIFDIWLRSRDIKLGLGWFWLSIIGMFLLIVILGEIWDRTHLFDYEAEFSNKRNPLLIKQVHELQRIREALEMMVRRKL